MKDNTDESFVWTHPELKTPNYCPGQYSEMIILMKEPGIQVQTPTTTQPTKPLKQRKLSQFGKKEQNSCCSIIALERHENQTKLVLYAFNVKDDILSKIKHTIKNAVNVQVMRNQFMSAAMKLKLGLYHELHHGLTGEVGHSKIENSF